jgi:choline dehydrogenase-like flavoprotein
MTRNDEHSEALATSAEVAAFYRVPAKTLDQWAYLGKGPRFSKIGRHRRYRWEDVRAFVDANEHDPTAA